MSDNQTELLAPLPSGRKRDAHVERQIAHWVDHTPAQMVRGAKGNPESFDYPQEETLVYLLRHCHRTGQMEAAFQLLEILIERSARIINHIVYRWRMTPTEREDCKQQAYAQMCEALFSNDRKDEFWEIRFGLCLARKVKNILAKFGREQGNEIPESQFGDEDDAPMLEREINRINLSGSSPEKQVFLAEALASLKPEERIAFLMFHEQGHPQEEIARFLKVEDRTVRNYLRRAEKRLLEWWKTDD
jgi:RNA polymerase sigma factor (sigma-70 family)